MASDLESADLAPTKAQVELFEEAIERLTAAMSRWEKLEEELM